jgi:hypothetical protein
VAWCVDVVARCNPPLQGETPRFQSHTPRFENAQA